jgi:hypothetical protein
VERRFDVGGHPEGRGAPASAHRQSCTYAGLEFEMSRSAAWFDRSGSGIVVLDRELLDMARAWRNCFGAPRRDERAASQTGSISVNLRIGRPRVANER